jgi:hypothetical protein
MGTERFLGQSSRPSIASFLPRFQASVPRHLLLCLLSPALPAFNHHVAHRVGALEFVGVILGPSLVLELFRFHVRGCFFPHAVCERFAVRD